MSALSISKKLATLLIVFYCILSGTSLKALVHDFSHFVSGTACTQAKVSHDIKKLAFKNTYTTLLQDECLSLKFLALLPRSSPLLQVTDTCSSVLEERAIHFNPFQYSIIKQRFLKCNWSCGPPV